MYPVDANVLIEAHRTYYAPDLAPVFWEWMAEQAEKGTIASVSPGTIRMSISMVQSSGVILGATPPDSFVICAVECPNTE